MNSFRSTTTTLIARNSLSRPGLRRRVLFSTVPTALLVAVAVALSLLTQAGRIEAAGPKFRVLATVPIPTNAQSSVTVNQALNKIYTSGGASGGQDVFVIDGTFPLPTPTPTPIDAGTGSGASVDNKSNRYWAATVYNGTAIVRDCNTNGVLATVSLGFCPIQTNYDFKFTRVWASAQCGPCNDPIWAIDANTFAITAGPISSGGVMGGIIANSATGRLYYAAQPGCSGPYFSKRVNPTTFAVTDNAFGRVLAINALTNTLYAVPDGTNNLQIIDGAPDPEVILRTITLPYGPAGMAINPALNYLYIENPAGNSLEVRDPSTGGLIATFSLPLPPNGPIAVDSIRGRIYVMSQSNTSPQLMVIEDLINAFKPGAIISHF